MQLVPFNNYLCRCECRNRIKTTLLKADKQIVKDTVVLHVIVHLSLTHKGNISLLTPTRDTQKFSMVVNELVCMCGCV